MSERRLRWALRLLREPLVHFLLLGGLLLGVDHARTPKPPAGEGRRIVVTRRQVEDLRSDWVKRRGRPPTADEERQEIDRYVDDEALFRTAVGLGLHESDLIVRHRLVQRMHFLHEDLAPVREPSEGELYAYVAARPDRYARAATVSFDHVFFSRSMRGEALAASASEAFAALAGGGRPGSDPYPLPLRTEDQPQDELAKVLGPGLARELFTLPVGAWRGPIESSFGLHLVRVRAIRQGEADFAGARRQAREDWLADKKQEVERALLATLRQGFEVVREGPASGADPGSAGRSPLEGPGGGRR